jgi:SAM-dependent methyltransferase
MLDDLLKRIRTLDVSREIAPNDLMYHPDHPDHYFDVGRSAIRVILSALLARFEYFGGDTEIAKILDFGCGHGRVARYLRAAFPHAELAVCDYDPTGVAWCVEHFGCRAIAEPAPESFDLVWLGSVFTHLPPAISERVLAAAAGALRTNGVLVFTSQGRYSRLRHEAEPDKPPYGIGRDLMDRIVTGLRVSGYGFAEYPGQKDYGVTMIHPAWFQQRILSSPGFVHILFQEKGWDNHQDVHGFMRTNLLDPRKGAYAVSSTTRLQSSENHLQGPQATNAMPEWYDIDTEQAFRTVRERLAAYLQRRGRFYPGVLDGTPVAPRPELLKGCEVLADRLEIMRRLPQNRVFAEIGTLFGDFIVDVIDIQRPLEVHLFDQSFEPLRPENRARLDSYGNAFYHTGDSSRLLAEFPDATFDVVYIDADHSYEGVWKDLMQGLRVLKPDGRLVCNDYTSWDQIQCIPYGVYSAVNRFANEQNLQFEYLALHPYGFHDVCLRRGDVR